VRIFATTGTLQAVLGCRPKRDEQPSDMDISIAANINLACIVRGNADGQTIPIELHLGEAFGGSHGNLLERVSL
jgi:hypothetical protein